jgi:hypothetical protein
MEKSLWNELKGARSNPRAAGSGKNSLGFGGVIALDPIFPPAFQGVGFLESQADHLLCHPGTGPFVGSGAVKDEGLVFGVLFSPGFGILGGVFSNRPQDLLIAVFPI